MQVSYSVGYHREEGNVEVGNVFLFSP